MKEMQRLSSGSPNPLTRALLRAGRTDHPSEGARRTAAVALGVAGGIAATTTTASAGAGAAGGAGAAASKWIGSVGIVKWLGATVVSGALVAGVVHEQRRAPPVSVSPPTSLVSPPTPARTRSAASAPLALPTAVPIPAPSATPDPAPSPIAASPIAPSPITIDVAPPQSPPDAIANVHGRGPSRVTSAADDAALRNEVQRLDRARDALAQGRPDAALAELKAYARASPHGALADEAAVLRIDALARAGRKDAAITQAEELLARDRDSPHARRVRALLASIRGGTGAH